MFFNEKRKKKKKEVPKEFDDEAEGSDMNDYLVIIDEEGIWFGRSYSYLIYSNIFFIFISFFFFQGLCFSFLIINTFMWHVHYATELNILHGQGEEGTKKKVEEVPKTVKKKKKIDRLLEEEEEEEEDVDEDLMTNLDPYLCVFYRKYGIIEYDPDNIVDYFEILKNYDIFYHFFFTNPTINNVDFILSNSNVRWIKKEINLKKLEKEKIKNYKWKENILCSTEEIYIIYKKYLDILLLLEKNNKIMYMKQNSLSLSWTRINKIIKYYYKKL